MAKYEVIVEVAYHIEADSEDEAQRLALDNANGCDVVDTNIMSTEEID
jgi:hypothetical protein